jgi:hypothetical protein
LKNNLPVERPISWPMLIPQIVVLALLVAASYTFIRSPTGAPMPLWGFVAYLAYSQGSRWLLLKSHRRGISLMRQGQYLAAVEQFEKSYAFFSKYPWIDQYRALTMLTAAKRSYREMALVNCALCYSQLEDVGNTRMYCARTLREFPDSLTARRLIEHIDAFGKEGVRRE